MWHAKRSVSFIFFQTSVGTCAGRAVDLPPCTENIQSAVKGNVPSGSSPPVVNGGRGDDVGGGNGGGPSGMSGAGGGMGLVAIGVIFALELADPPLGADPLPSAADVDWTDAGGVGAL